MESENKPVRTINLVLEEDLINSLNFMLDKQNFELMKIVSSSQIIHLKSLLKFYYNLPDVEIPLKDGQK
uniref:Uncharacterized protein n=1 Tax=viral metagenome TaxID=1070528 RepID=A0A6C0E817_9ZZZZ